MKSFLLFLFSALLITNALTAQDLIIKKNNETIQCIVKEIGTDEVKYLIPSINENVLFSLEKDQIAKIVFHDGKEMEFSSPLTNPNVYADQRKNILKIDFYSPLTGNTTLAYERSLKPGRSIETALGIIGAGMDPGDRNSIGVFIRGGYKFIKDPDFYLRGMKYAHVLKGTYFKPEINVSLYRRDYEEIINDPPYFVTERKNVYAAALMLTFGKQWIFADLISVDGFVGVGYGLDNTDGGYHYGFSVASREFPMSFSAGLKLGILFLK